MLRPIIIAHHGASVYKRGDILDSCEKTIKIGADMLEFDLRRTKDHVLIAYHDRLINGKPINQFTYKELEAGLKQEGKHLTTVSDILELARSKIRIDLELKEEGYENEVIECLSGHLHEDDFVITSFNDTSLKTIKNNFPGVRVGLLLGKPSPDNLLRTRISEIFPMARAEGIGADFLVPNFRLLKLGFLDRAKRSHRSVFVWTVNDEEMMAKLLKENRVNGIITDKPEVALDMKNRMGSGGSQERLSDVLATLS